MRPSSLFKYIILLLSFSLVFLSASAAPPSPHDGKGNTATAPKDGKGKAATAPKDGKGKAATSPKDGKGKGKAATSPRDGNAKGKTVAAPEDDIDFEKGFISEVCGVVSSLDGRFKKEYCISVLEAAPFDKSEKGNLHGLGSMTLTLLNQNVTATKARIEKMVKSGNNKPQVIEVLKECISIYDAAVDDTTLALEHYENKNYDDADLKTSLMGGDGYECEAAFKAQSLRSPLTKENEDSQYLSAIAVLIIRMFNKTYTPWGTRIVNA